MKLTWCGLPLNGRQVATSAFKVMFILYAVYILVIHVILGSAIRNNEASTGMKVVRGTIQITFLIFIVIVTMRARGYIRRKYNIPEESCPGYEDCCCSFWCNACTVRQMLRHTADYQLYNAGCCAQTGLANGAPEVI
jgi:Cys-rich protein (TIGR01571 family)